MRYTPFIFVFCSLYSCHSVKKADQVSNSKPSISFTFDDGNIADMPGYPLETWNEKILEHLSRHRVKAILFSAGANKTGPKGQYVLSSWDKAGHRIGNHTISHRNLGSEKATLADFEWELMANDSIIRAFANYIPLFRFPYLKEGNTAAQVAQYRQLMLDKGYKNGHVTIDASDWYVDSRLVARLKQQPDAEVEGFRKFYVAHLFDRATYYESLAQSITGRPINHVILLHHNFAAALFLGDLIQHFKDHGWDIKDADKAYADPVFALIPTHVPAGESLIWALAKSSGKYEKQLRYPAEDGDYEKEKMDLLGL